MVSPFRLFARDDAWQPVDQLIRLIVMGLAALGVVAVYSAIAFLAETKGNSGTEHFLLMHVGKVCFGLLLMVAFSRIDYHLLARWSKAALAFSILLLLAVQVVGVVSGGAARWLHLGFIGFQPSDFAKVSLVLYLSVLLERKQAYIRDFHRAFLPVMLWIGLTTLLIGIENLSTASLVLLVACTLCFIGGIRWTYLASIAVVGVFLAYLFLLTSPGRAARVESYLGMKLFPGTESEQVFNAQDEGYQAQQARIAIAMGGLTGVGPGKSIQRDFLPAPYNDFIFAIIAEEYGIVGALLILAGLGALLYRGFACVARNAPDTLGLLCGVGFTMLIVVYGFIHAGVSTGLLPVTGLPMPFVSYGGSSLVATGVMVGILLNISRQSVPKAEVPGQAGPGR